MSELSKSGVFLRVNRPWLNRVCPQAVGIAIGNLPKDPPIDISEIWSEFWSDDEQEMSLTFQMDLPSPTPILACIWNDCLRFARPTLLWERGLIAHVGCNEFFIYSDYGNLVMLRLLSAE